VTTTQDAAAKADIARSHGQQAAEDAKGRAAEVTHHAQDAAHDVAGTAAEQAQNVKDETVRQARNLVSEASSQLSSQAGSQTQKLTDSLRDLGDELRQMAESGSGGTASELVHQASDRVHQAAGFLEGREPSEILSDVRGFAQRRPGAFLAGAAVLGLIAGRVGRGVKDASGDLSSSTSGHRTSGYSTSRARVQTPAPLTAPPGESTAAMGDYGTGAYGTGDGFESAEGDATSRIDLTSEPYTSSYAPEYGSEVQR
jgi:hypothetical protein